MEVVLIEKVYLAAESEDCTPNVVTPASSVTEPAVSMGMECGSKTLYSGPEDKRGRYTWIDTIPEDLGTPAEDAETEKWALIVRQIKYFGDPRRVLKMHSIVVQSPLLKKLLAKVLKDYPGVTTSLQRLEFSGRFEPLIHRWSDLVDAIEKEEHPTTKDHAKLLYDVLWKEFKDLIEEAIDLKANKVATFELLWTLFEPGAMVYVRLDGQENVFKLVDAKYGVGDDSTPLLNLTCQYVDWDGSKFGTAKLHLKIKMFGNTQPITQLPIYPLQFHAKATEVRKRLVERGGRVESLSGFHYQAYSGIGSRKGQWEQNDKYDISGRIVIDTACWNRFNPNERVNLISFKESNFSDTQNIYTGDSLGDDYYSSDEAEYSEDEMSVDEDGVEGVSRRKPLSEEQKLICTPTLRGYSLQMKLWLKLSVSGVKEIEWSKDAFNSLVLPENQKELILGFTESQRKLQHSFDDVIKGKGKGIILLLCGSPGVGKTLTAESVAEEMRTPLYMMSAGDLGLDPSGVEEKLNNILEMCSKWNAILLIDEADVFLEQRSLHELERNKLVSIFLRVLEYYEGIMFLTTNRVQTFDAAFQSRIHISLEYPALNAESRKSVWRNFLATMSLPKPQSASSPPTKRASVKGSTSIAVTKSTPRTTEPASAEPTSTTSSKIENTITDAQLEKLSLIEINGRQIKNVLKTAQLLASRKDQKLGYDHVKTVLDVTQHLHNSTEESDRQRSAIFA